MAARVTTVDDRVQAAVRSAVQWLRDHATQATLRELQPAAKQRAAVV